MDASIVRQLSLQISGVHALPGLEVSEPDQEAPSADHGEPDALHSSVHTGVVISGGPCNTTAAL